MEETEDSGVAAATPAPRPIIYARSASNEGQLEERLEDSRALAHLHGLDVAQDDCIAEYGSGADIDRPGLQRVLEMVERGQISHLVCRDWSRLSRNQRHLHRIMATLAEAGVTVVTEPGINEPTSAPDLALQPLVARR